jgi:RNA polymerase sigma-70 factor (ECF subfamily)
VDQSERLKADARLVERVGAGDEAAFAEVVRLTRPRVVHIAAHFFRRPDVIDDVVQGVFEKAFVALESWGRQVPLEHWLARIAVNACHDELRRRRRSVPTEAGRPIDDEVDDPAVWEREETRLWAEQALAQLPAADRVVLTLMVLEELSVAEVAGLTGWSRVNVKVRAFRARRRLRQLLGADKGRE